MLQGAGCYERRDVAIRQVIPEYEPHWKSKIVLPNLLQEGGYREAYGLQEELGSLNQLIIENELLDPRILGER